MARNISQTDFTPPQIARMLGANVETIKHFIYSGELEAYNLSTGQTRPRYRISQEALEDFRKRRSVTNRPAKTTTTVRKLV